MVFIHCLKMSKKEFFGLHFSVFRLNTEIYYVNLCIYSEYLSIKTRPEKTPYLVTFHAVIFLYSICK